MNGKGIVRRGSQPAGNQVDCRMTAVVEGEPQERIKHIVSKKERLVSLSCGMEQTASNIG